MKQLTVVDLFAGCGGLSKGFEMAGFRVLAANDIWKLSLDTLKLNHPGTEIIHGNLTKPEVQKRLIDAVDRKADVIVGGPPCQAYSLAGKRDPNDPRGKLFHAYVDIVKQISPKLFIMENVKGILTMWHYKGLSKKDETEVEGINKKIEPLTKKRRELWVSGREKTKRERQSISREIADLREELKVFKEPVTEMIKREFDKIDYDVKWQLFNVADFGVPELRERVIFIGAKGSTKIRFPGQTHSNLLKSDASGKPLKPWATLKDAIWDLRGRPGKLFEGSFSTIYMSRNRRKNWGEPSFTIQAGARHAPLHPDSPPMVKVGEDRWVFKDKNNVRRLSVKECARIQTFPDNFKFKGSVTDRYKQIGNAVPPLFAKSIGESVKGMLAAP